MNDKRLDILFDLIEVLRFSGTFDENSTESRSVDKNSEHSHELFDNIDRKRLLEIQERILDLDKSMEAK